MAKQSKGLSKTSQAKINKFLKNANRDNNFNNEFSSIVKKDVLMIKDCSEKSIVDFYIDECEKLLEQSENNITFNDEVWGELKAKTRARLAAKYVSGKHFDNNIDIYFNEVKREYILHPQGESEDMEFLPENRDIFIANNLKLVINCAKRYRNLGLPFDDLIQIGNVGLLMAWDKFDTDRANLRHAILEDIQTNEHNEWTYEQAQDLVKRNFKYSKTLDATLMKLPQEGFVSKEAFITWAEQNIKKASFSSIGFAWIRAMILLELNNLAKVIKIPKSAQDDEENKINIIYLDSINPYTEDNYADGIVSEITNEEFAVEDENIENMEQKNMFKEFVSKLLMNLPAMDRRIIKKRFGIGVPYQLSISEIAENEGITTNRVKYIITSALKTITNSIPEKDKETIIEMLR